MESVYTSIIMIIMIINTHNNKNNTYLVRGFYLSVVNSAV